MAGKKALLINDITEERIHEMCEAFYEMASNLNMTEYEVVQLSCNTLLTLWGQNHSILAAVQGLASHMRALGEEIECQNPQ